MLHEFLLFQSATRAAPQHLDNQCAPPQIPKRKWSFSVCGWSRHVHCVWKGTTSGKKSPRESSWSCSIQCRVVMLHILGRFFVVTEFFATTFYFTNRPRSLSYELPHETSSLLAPNVSTRKLCSSHHASGVHNNSSFVKRDVDSCNALCADVVLSSSTTCSKGLCVHVPRILSARSCVLGGVFFANSSDKLSVPQPGLFFQSRLRWLSRRPVSKSHRFSGDHSVQGRRGSASSPPTSSTPTGLGGDSQHLRA